MDDHDSSLAVAQLWRHINLGDHTMSGADLSQKRLSDLGECFADHDAYLARLAQGDDIVYTVATAPSLAGPGDLAYGLGTLQPGTVGDEYFLTRGHYHAWREAAEVYIGLSGQGGLVLQNEAGDQFVPLGAGDVVYVPGFTAHRTVNTGQLPLVYLGIYPARAGHDYAGIAEDNFNLIVRLTEQGPQVVARNHYRPATPDLTKTDQGD